MRALTSLTALLLLAGCSDYGFSDPNDVGSDLATGPNDPDRPDDDGDDPNDPNDPGDDDDPGYGDPDDPLFSVTGNICDPSTEGWVVGAYVYVSIDVDGDGVEDYRVEAETGAGGVFTLAGLPEGTWTVHVEKGSFTTSFEVTVGVDQHLFMDEAECLDPDSIAVAVVSGEYDHIEDLLDDMTIGYDLYDGVSSTAYIDLLRDPAAMAEYDVIFLNCGIGFDWFSYYSEIGQNIAQFVAAGGSIYASDWAYYFIEVAVADAIDFYDDDATVGAAMVGDIGDLQAQVIDPYMQILLGGGTADIGFELNNWVVPVGVDPDVEVLLQADAGLWQSSTTVTNSPIAAYYEPIPDQGVIIYTAFHNETQITVDMRLLLMEIILSL